MNPKRARLDMVEPSMQASGLFRRGGYAQLLANKYLEPDNELDHVQILCEEGFFNLRKQITDKYSCSYYIPNVTSGESDRLEPFLGLQNDIVVLNVDLLNYVLGQRDILTIPYLKQQHEATKLHENTKELNKTYFENQLTVMFSKTFASYSDAKSIIIVCLDTDIGVMFVDVQVISIQRGQEKTIELKIAPWTCHTKEFVTNDRLENYVKFVVTSLGYLLLRRYKSTPTYDSKQVMNIREHPKELATALSDFNVSWKNKNLTVKRLAMDVRWYHSSANVTLRSFMYIKNQIIDTQFKEVYRCSNLDKQRLVDNFDKIYSTTLLKAIRYQSRTQAVLNESQLTTTSVMQTGTYHAGGLVYFYYDGNQSTFVPVIPSSESIWNGAIGFRVILVDYTSFILHFDVIFPTKEILNPTVKFSFYMKNRAEDYYTDYKKNELGLFYNYLKQVPVPKSNSRTNIPAEIKEKILKNKWRITPDYVSPAAYIQGMIKKHLPLHINKDDYVKRMYMKAQFFLFLRNKDDLYLKFHEESDVQPN
jgi:hypothetical protein